MQQSGRAMRTKFCDLVGIAAPIVLAPLGGAAGPNLAAAVSNAGGLGTLALWDETIENLRLAVRQMHLLTNKPFAVNLNMAFPQEEHLEACLEEDVPIISFFWQDPSPLVRKAKDAGAIIMHTVGNADDARRAVGCGVDVVVAQGWEAGGHVRGSVATLPLVPAVVDAVGDVPVVAAGGIADGRGLAAVLALGASAAWIGTRFLASEEVEIHPEYQRRLLGASENDTVYLENLFDVGWPDAPHRALRNVGWPDAPHRVLRNSTIDDWEAAGRPPSGKRPGEGEVVATSQSDGQILRYQIRTPRPVMHGNIESLPMWAGQGVSIVSRVQPAAQIVSEIVNDAAARLRELADAGR